MKIIMKMFRHYDGANDGEVVVVVVVVVVVNIAYR